MQVLGKCGTLGRGLAEQWSSCKGITSVLQLHSGFHLGLLTNTINSTMGFLLWPAVSTPGARQGGGQ